MLTRWGAIGGVVVDASVAATRPFGEMEPRAERVLERLEEAGALAPQLPHLEVRNALTAAGRRGRLSTYDALYLELANRGQ